MDRVRDWEHMPTYSLDIISFVLGTLFGIILLIALTAFLNRAR